MWRSVLAVVLLPSLTAAKAPPQGAPEFSKETVNAILYGPSRTLPAPQPLYRAYTRYDAIRRGRDEEVGIQLRTDGFVTSAKSAVPGVVPLKLEFEPLDGVTVKEIHDPKVDGGLLKFKGEPVKATRWPYVHFKIRADRNAPLGLRVLKGKFTFQQFSSDGSGIGPVEQVDLRIPLNVMEHDAVVHKTDFPYAPTPAWEIVVLIIAVPVLIAIVLPFFLLCVATGRCNTD
jgi:hypothetical protein